MEIKSAEFLKSSAFYSDCPEPLYPEYAFLGRSNVGKSSLINMITGHSKLAKTSATPGKTQLINHFLINQSWYLSDLPGYGFAKVSKKERARWEQMIKNYLLHRTNLLCTFLLIDSRLEPQQIDLTNMGWFGSNGLPFVLVFTKADKLSTVKLDAGLSKYKKILSENWDPLPDIFITSAEKKEGRDNILSFIHHYNTEYKNSTLNNPG